MPPTAIGLLATDDMEPALLLEPLGVNGVQAKRSKALKLVGGLAAAASNEMFKGPQTRKPLAKSWERRKVFREGKTSTPWGKMTHTLSPNETLHV